VKNILKKNQVIITALAIMIAVAGYLNFTQDKVNKYMQTEGEVVEVNAQGEEIETVLDSTGTKKETEVPVGENPTSTEGTPAQEDKALTDLSEEDTATVSDKGEIVEKDSETIGESVLVNNTIGKDFFSAAKLTREQTRAKNKEILMELVNNEKITEKQKENAINEVIALTTIAEKETATEILLEAKGFEGVVVSILDENVEVIVNANKLTDQQIAQVEDIVKRKTNFSADKIVISPVGVKDTE
jgi:stage III sporulation protein AH